MADFRLIVLVSKGTLNRKQQIDQSRALSILEAKRIPFELVDGMDVSMRERRNELFAISGLRAHYPQFFVAGDEDATPTFIGECDTVESINDCSSLPDDVLKSNPKIMTWDRLFNGEGIAGL